MPEKPRKRVELFGLSTGVSLMPAAHDLKQHQAPCGLWRVAIRLNGHVEVVRPERILFGCPCKPGRDRANDQRRRRTTA